MIDSNFLKLINIKTYSIISIFFFSCWTFSQTTKIKQLESQRLLIKKEIENINSLLFNNSKTTKIAYNDLENISIRILKNQELIRLTNQQINILTNEIDKKNDSIDFLKSEIKQVRKQYSLMIMNSYKSKLKESRLMFLLSSDDFLQALKRTRYINQFSEDRKRVADKISNSINLLDQKITMLNSLKSDKKNLLKQNKENQINLKSEEKSKERLISGLRRKEKAYKKQINDKQKISINLDKEIDRLIKEAIRKSNNESNNNIFKLTPEARALSEKFSANKGNLPWPVVRGVVIRKFGLQPHPVVRTTKIQSNGLVIATTKDAEIRAVFNGFVLSILKFKGSNITVLIQHGSYITAYKNIDEVYVEKGEKVSALQKIGKVFDPKDGSKSTLQFSIFNNTKAIDPYIWIVK
ncbi:MAG: peptidase M23 [Gammaproteobacteria bacterium]|nr:peptidase M23 [Gammaproteobacteria bacterium]